MGTNVTPNAGEHEGWPAVILDDDVRRLADEAERAFGQDAVNAAIERAYAHAAAGSPESAIPFAEALRIELRRMLKDRTQ
jgi:hypothetical protein